MKIYNSLTRKKEPFRPIKDKEVGIYVCGPTVYDEPHIGHARAAYIFEVVRNHFNYQGYKVKFVKNITDIDDKIIARAKKELPKVEINAAVKTVAEKYTQRYVQDMQALGIRQASYTPRATQHIGQIKDYITRLIEKEFAYEVDGNVYFNVRRFKDYGRLSHQKLNQMRSAVRIEKGEKKKDPLDFALWKKAKADQPSWVSPWGRGRPGWHIECSVMSSRYLGEEFDIHAGGIDLIFPHHENEIAQSRCFSAKGFARLWMHNGLLTIKQQKMAKSLGNFVSVKDFLKTNIPQVLKLFFLSCHYRSPIDFNQKKINEAKKLYERFYILNDKLNRTLVQDSSGAQRAKPNKDITKFREGVNAAMDDDFNTPQALAVLCGLATFSNRLLGRYKGSLCHHKLAEGSSGNILQGAQELLAECSNVFAINFTEIPEKGISEARIEAMIETRQQLRRKGNFAAADRIRKDLEAKGVVLEDTKEQTLWRRRI